MDVPASSSLTQSSHWLAWRPWKSAESRLLTRYVLVSGVFGLPASIIQLQLMIWGYEAFIGDVDRVTLNILWVINFELSLVRNFLLHCAFTWGIRPNRRRLMHAHVAATGAFFIDLVVFNTVLYFTDIIPVAQFVGASSGFLCNFLYNRFRTFGSPRKSEAEAMAEGGIP